MMEIITLSAEVLSEVGFTTSRISINDRDVLVFEDPTVLGFLFAYENSGELIGAWEKDAGRAIADNQFGLRRAAQKAWNTYVVLVAGETGDYSHSSALAAIEEDLTGTRKIARAGVSDMADLRAALLPLLPLQAAPKLEAVDIQAEIRQRATELPPRAIDAFLSAADGTVVMQVLEEAP